LRTRDEGRELCGHALPSLISVLSASSVKLNAIGVGYRHAEVDAAPHDVVRYWEVVSSVKSVLRYSSEKPRLMLPA